MLNDFLFRLRCLLRRKRVETELDDDSTVLSGIFAFMRGTRVLRAGAGSERSDVLWMVMRGTLFVLVVGGALGLPAAVGAAQVLRSLLFALGTSDPQAIAWATATLFGAGALAGFLPARRAASLSPMDALRHE
jgi:predicted lysophospholipase L1 biosynthesis ABC-type transport system permease subunit